MPTTLELCEKYFKTKDLYEMLSVTKDSIEKEIKKAYYRLSLQVHPDRVSAEEKDVATEKFKLLGKVYSILADKDKRALYDEKGIIDDEDDNLSNWIELWKNIFKPITTEEIDKFQQEYIGSELEKSDIRKAYLNGKGCINYMMDSVPFMSVEDEPRIIAIVKEWIDAEEVPEYKQFVNEPNAKRNKRHRKYQKESKEAKIIQEKLKKNGDSLEQQIMKRQADRKSNMNNFFDSLMAKYGDVDDSEEYKAPKAKKPKVAKTDQSAENGTTKKSKKLDKKTNGSIESAAVSTRSTRSMSKK